MSKRGFSFFSIFTWQCWEVGATDGLKADRQMMGHTDSSGLMCIVGKDASLPPHSLPTTSPSFSLSHLSVASVPAGRPAGRGGGALIWALRIRTAARSGQISPFGLNLA